MSEQKKLSMAEILKRKREERLKKEKDVSLQQTVENLISNSENIIHKISINDLKTNPYQPRIHMNEEELNELVKSIQKNGLMSPIIVTEINGEKIIVAGHRRVEACKKLNWSEIPAILRKDIDNTLLALLAITENTHRSNLNPIELALSYKELLTNAFASQKELAIALGINPIKITRILNLLKLDPRIIEAVKEGQTKDILALNLLNQIKNHDTQYHLFLGFLKNGREWLENEIKKHKGKKEEFVEQSYFLKSNLKKGELKIKLDTKKFSQEKIKEIEEKILDMLNSI